MLDLNFLPPSYKANLAKRQRALRWVTATVAVLCAVALAVTLHHRS